MYSIRIKLIVADEGYRKKFKKVHNNDVYPPLSEHHVRVCLIRRIQNTRIEKKHRIGMACPLQFYRIRKLQDIGSMSV
jgi:hypothetical protein